MNLSSERGKNNKGRIVDGQWIFGGICHETKQMFFVSVEKCDKAPLLSIIKERIKEGTTIISDGWAAYKSLKNKGYDHYVSQPQPELCRSHNRCSHSNNREFMVADKTDSY